MDLFCSANPRAVVKDLDNCAHFINCSHKNSDLGKFYQECTYPDLFSDVTMKCESFQAVSCKHRPEPQAPCKPCFQLNLRKLFSSFLSHILLIDYFLFSIGQYEQNLKCVTGQMSCAPCPERLPSCIGLSDGLQPFTGLEWTSSYIVCLQNRTMDIRRCPQRAIFNPQTHQCINKIDQSMMFVHIFAYNAFMK